MTPHEHPEQISREFLEAFAILKKHGRISGLTGEEYAITSEAFLRFEQFKDIPVLFSNPQLLSRLIELLSIREFKAGKFIYEDGVHKGMKYFLIEGDAVYTRQNHIHQVASEKQILFQKLEEKSQINASEDKKRAFQLIQGLKNHRNKPVKVIHLGQLFGSRQDYNKHLCFKAKRMEADYQKQQENLESLQSLSVQAQSDCMVVCLPQRSYDYVFSAYVQKLTHLISVLCQNFRSINIEDRERVGTEYFLHMCHDGIYQRKEIIIQQGTPTDYLYFIKSGNVQIQKSITELYQYGANQYLLQKNFFNSKTYDHNAQATESDTRITRISKPFIALLLNIKTLCPIKNIISKNAFTTQNQMSPHTFSTVFSSPLSNKPPAAQPFQQSQQVLLQYASQSSQQIPSLSASSVSYQNLNRIHSSILDNTQASIPVSLREIQIPPNLSRKSNSSNSIPNLHYSTASLGSQETGEPDKRQDTQISMTSSVGRKRRDTRTCIEADKSSEDGTPTFKQFELTHPESVVSIVKGRHTLRRMKTTNYQTQNDSITDTVNDDDHESPPLNLSFNTNNINRAASTVSNNFTNNNETDQRTEKRTNTFLHPKIMNFDNILPQSFSSSPVIAPTPSFRSSSINIVHQNSFGAAIPKKTQPSKPENTSILKLSGFKKLHEDKVKESNAPHILFGTQASPITTKSQQGSLISRKQIQLRVLSSQQTTNSFQLLKSMPIDQFKQTSSPQALKQAQTKQNNQSPIPLNKH